MTRYPTFSFAILMTDTTGLSAHDRRREVTVPAGRYTYDKVGADEICLHDPCRPDGLLGCVKLSDVQIVEA